MHATVLGLGRVVRGRPLPGVCAMSVPRQGQNIASRSLVFSARALSHPRADPQRGEYLPEDPTPAMWQRVAQLIAGAIATGSLVYFVLFADFGEGEHCFMPVRILSNADPPRAQRGPRGAAQALGDVAHPKDAVVYSHLPCPLLLVHRRRLAATCAACLHKKTLGGRATGMCLRGARPGSGAHSADR